MIADIFITTTTRADLFRQSLTSFLACTDRTRTPFRLTVVCDGRSVGSENVVADFAEHIDHAIVHRDNLGLGPSITQALAYIDATNTYFSDAGAPDPQQVAPFICYCQDDLLYTPAWLEQLATWFCLYENVHRLGFASGVECVEHGHHRVLSDGSPGGPRRAVLKRYIRAAQMFARREYWMSMYPITRLDHETRRVRAKPDNGMGSGADWHFIRNHPNSVERTGRNCLVLPGLVQHAGYDRSTWLARELPESEEDRAIIAMGRMPTPEGL